MTWVAALGWLLFCTTVADRAFHSYRLWWAPLFGLSMQLLWVVYAVGLGPAGWPCGAMAVAIGVIYVRNVPRWLRTRRSV